MHIVWIKHDGCLLCYRKTQDFHQYQHAFFQSSQLDRTDGKPLLSIYRNNLNYNYFALLRLLPKLRKLYKLQFASGFLVMYYPHYILKESHARSAISTFMICAAAATCGFFSRTLRQIGYEYE